MAKAKKKEKTPAELRAERYFAMQLTPEQKAEARAELEQQVEVARRDGAYERLLEIVGTVEWSVSWEELRRED